METSVKITRKPKPNLFIHTCRVCMGSDKNMKSLYEGTKQAVQPICDKILFCTGIQITEGDGLPSKICNQCLKDLNTAYNFKYRCLQAEEVFKLKKESKIKIEMKEKCFKNDCYEAEENIDETFSENMQSYDPSDLDKSPCRGLNAGLVKIEIDNATATKMNSEEDYQKTRNEIISMFRENVKKYTKMEESLKKNKIIEDKLIDERPKPTVRRRRRLRHCEYKCNISVCNVTFQTKALHAEHNRTVHGKTSFMCEVCGKVFRHQSSHSIHKLTHQEPRFHCDNCDYRTFYRQDLVKHVRTHSGSRTYKCPECPVLLSTSSNRLAHVRRVHLKLTQFTCHVCGRAFKEKTEMTHHLDAHQDVKRHVCEVCEGRFSRQSHLRRHLLKQHKIKLTSERFSHRRRQNATQQASKQSTNQTQPSNIISLSDI